MIVELLQEKDKQAVCSLLRQCFPNVKLQEVFDFKKIDFFTDREYKKFVNKPTTQSIYDLARKIFNKNNLPYITFLGNLTEKDVPTYDQICKTIYRGVK